MKKDEAIRKAHAEVMARNEMLEKIALPLVFKDGGMRRYGYIAAQYVRDHEMDDTDVNMGLGILSRLKSRSDIAAFAWFERFFGPCVTEYVDAIDDGQEFISGVYEAYRDGVLGVPPPKDSIKSDVDLDKP